MSMNTHEEDVKILRELLWLNHGHTGLYGDDGEMQCAECMEEYGFLDWKRTPVKEIRDRIYAANMRKMVNQRYSPPDLPSGGNNE
jgi:hypothetical protein